MGQDGQDGFGEVEGALRRRAVELWGEERAAEIEGTIEDAARSIWLVESNAPPADEEPAQYLTSFRQLAGLVGAAGGAAGVLQGHPRSTGLSQAI